MPGCIVSATTASFRSVEKRRLRATPVITSTVENVSDIGVCLGLSLGPPASAAVRSKRGAVHVLEMGTPIELDCCDFCDDVVGTCHRSCDSPRLWALKIPWLAFPPTIQPGRAAAEWLSRHRCHPPLGGGGADGPTWRTDDDPGTASTWAVGHRDRAADGA